MILVWSLTCYNAYDFYLGRVAYKKLLALSVELVSSRCSAQALFTHCSPNSLTAQTLLTLLSHYSLLHIYSRAY